ncbi:MAG: double zinc ribbon domain-containing protein [Burkholderiales bacterium]|nr:double zinc ribbon domain-containing protein [Burkholderiales bacterium]
MRIGSRLRRLAGATCLLCSDPAADRALCEGCFDDLPWIDAATRCPVCALPSPGAARCAACAAHPPAFDATVAAVDYAWPVDALVPALKYAHRLAVAGAMAEMLGRAVRGHPVPDHVVPLPLSAARLRERGFDQATEIVRLLPPHLAARVHLAALHRVRDTPPQAGLARVARERNLIGAFVARPVVAGRRIALVDDVMTSGATLHHAASALKAAGAAAVQAWVVARTPAPSDR